MVKRYWKYKIGDEKNKFDKPIKSMITKRKKHKGVNKMKMKIDFEKMKQLLEDKPNISEETTGKDFGTMGRNNRGD